MSRARWKIFPPSALVSIDYLVPVSCFKHLGLLSSLAPLNVSTLSKTVGSHPRHTFHRSVTMSNFHNCKDPILHKIRCLLTHLTTKPSEYDKITPKIEYWIEYVLREQFAMVDELAEGVSWIAWTSEGSHSNVGRFFKEFHDAPHRSEQARSFVTQLCSHILRWFAIASVEYLSVTSRSGSIVSGGGPGFIRAASFVGHLIKRGLLSQQLVRQHLIKPLINHYDGHEAHIWEPLRANAIYQLFIAAGSTLFQGLLEPEDIQLSFEKLDVQSRAEKIGGYDAARVKVRWTIYPC